MYARERTKGIKRIAITWKDIVWEATHAIGNIDAQRWLQSEEMAEILSDPHFVRDPIPAEWLAEHRLRAINRLHLLEHTWVSPHPEAWHKLGYYQVWRPNGYPVVEVFGEDKARMALLENRMKNSLL